MAGLYKKLSKNCTESIKEDPFQEEMHVQSKLGSSHIGKDNWYSRACKHNFLKKNLHISKAVSSSFMRNYKQNLPRVSSWIQKSHK